MLKHCGTQRCGQSDHYVRIPKKIRMFVADLDPKSSIAMEKNRVKRADFANDPHVLCEFSVCGLSAPLGFTVDHNLNGTG